MKNFSQRKKLFVIYVLTAFLPLAALSYATDYTANSTLTKVTTELVNERLAHDLLTTEYYLQAQTGSISMVNGALIDEQGNDLKLDTKLLSPLSEQLNTDITIYIKSDNTFERYLSTLQCDISTIVDSSFEQLYDTLASGQNYYTEVTHDQTTYYCTYLLLEDSDNNVYGLIELGMPTSELDTLITTEVNYTIMNNTVVSTTCIIFSVIELIVFGHLMSKPLLMLKKHANFLADLNLTHVMPESMLCRKDEIGVVANSMNLITQNLSELIQSVHDQSVDVSQISGELDVTCQEVSQASNNIATTVTEIADSATEQADHTSICMQNLEGLGTQVTLTTHKVSDLTEASNRVKQYVQKGQQVLNELASKIMESNSATEDVCKDIQITNQSADHINDIINIIGSIASQTNLLALNASIEAARAGEFGRGFTVVAEEIRKLADQSNESTKQIAQHLNLLQSQTNHCVTTTQNLTTMLQEQITAVDKTQEQYNQIAHEMDLTIHIISDMNETSTQMSSQHDILVSHIENLSSIAEENAASTQEASACVEEQGASVHDISDTIASLSKMTSDLTELIQKFTIA